MDDLGHYMLRCSELKAENERLARQILDARSLLARLADEADELLPSWVTADVDEIRAVLVEKPAP